MVGRREVRAALERHGDVGPLEDMMFRLADVLGLIHPFRSSKEKVTSKFEGVTKGLQQRNLQFVVGNQQVPAGNQIEL